MDPTPERPIAVVTGAASGIGASFARHFYREGYCLFLVDISQEKLSSFVDQLRNEESGDTMPGREPSVECYVADLTDGNEIDQLARTLGEMRGVELLVNNAGFGSLAEFCEVDADRHAAMIAIHVETPTRLIRAVLPQMRNNNRGSIINVSSLSAFAPCAESVLYSSSKAYLVVFSEALQEELRGTSVRVQALCPGFVRTGFHATDAMANFQRRRVPDSLWSTADDVVRCSLDGLSKGKVVMIPGWRSRALGLLMQMILIRPFVRALLRPRKRWPESPAAPIRDDADISPGANGKNRLETIKPTLTVGSSNRSEID